MHSARLPAGIFGALIRFLALPPTLQRQKTEPVSCSDHHSYPISQGSWAGAPAGPVGLPGDAGRGTWGLAAVAPHACTAALCPVGQLCSLPRK